MIAAGCVHWAREVQLQGGALAVERPMVERNRVEALTRLSSDTRASEIEQGEQCGHSEYSGHDEYGKVPCNASRVYNTL